MSTFVGHLCEYECLLFYSYCIEALCEYECLLFYSYCIEAHDMQEDYAMNHTASI